MQPYLLSFINGSILIVVSAWAYFGASDPSMTALIPGLFGLLILACNPGVKREHPAISHVAVVLTLLVALALIMPLTGAIARGDGLAIARVALMQLSSLVALAFFIKRFLDIRRARRSA